MNDSDFEIRFTIKVPNVTPKVVRAANFWGGLSYSEGRSSDE